MIRPWIGAANCLFIPLVVEGESGYDTPPADYYELIQRRVYFDPDPNTNEDRSLASYISSISYGRANLNATVSAPLTLRDVSDDANLTLLAINAHPDAHKYEYLAVVYPPNRRGAGHGMAQLGKIDFNPPRTSNKTVGRCRFLYDEALGTWAMEMLHIVTGIGDFYNGEMHPHRFDEMADAAATHPSAYTKLLAGWLDPGSVVKHPGGTKRYALHAIGLSHPAPAGRVAGIRVQAPGSDRYLIIEARLKTDRWERGFSGSSGIPSEGVVVMEFAPEDDPWPRLEANGPWPPLQLRTATALTAGQSFTHHDAWTTAEGPPDNRSGVGRHRAVNVVSAVAGGFVVEVKSDEPTAVVVPNVRERPAVNAANAIRAALLQPAFTGPSGSGAWVWKQSPAAGVSVGPGTTVRLLTRSGPRQ